LTNNHGEEQRRETPQYTAKNQMRYFDNTLLEIQKKYQENAMMISNRCNPIKKNIEA
jgi:hypothetical protein